MPSDMAPETFCFASLPSALQETIFRTLSSVELASAARVSKSWKAASESSHLWQRATARDFGSPQAATLAVLRRRAASTPNPYACQEKLVHRWLAARHTCTRCKAQFSDGANHPGACRFHSGILFSGGQLNGAALRWTCCNRRAHHIPTGARDANGCREALHAGELSAWEAACGSGVQPRVLGQVGGGQAGQAAVQGGQPLMGGGPELQEWHPDHRPGIIELPSRLLLSF